MTEKYPVVDKRTISYEGLFNASELFYTIDSWLRDNGYDKYEKKVLEKNLESGRFVQHKMEPYKKINDYVKLVIEITLTLSELKDVTIEKEGLKIALNKGKVDCSLAGVLYTDYEGRWETKPIFFFIGVLLDKFIFKTRFHYYVDTLRKDVTNLEHEIKTFLNLSRF